MANILVVGPHPDDQELGMGGTIARLVGQGHDVLLLDMTNGEPTPHGSVDKRKQEWTEAAQILGVRRYQLGLKNREIEHTLQARHLTAGVIREHQASIVFLPFPEDAHPDHRATTRIVEDARFDAKLTKTNMPGEPIYPKWMIYYYCMHLRQIVNPTFCIDISDQIATKEKSILAYKTQFVIPEKTRNIVDWLRHLSGYLGSRVGCEYAEPFFLNEPLGLSALDDLVM